MTTIKLLGLLIVLVIMLVALTSLRDQIFPYPTTPPIGQPLIFTRRVGGVDVYAYTIAVTKHELTAAIVGHIDPDVSRITGKIYTDGSLRTPEGGVWRQHKAPGVGNYMIEYDIEDASHRIVVVHLGEGSTVIPYDRTFRKDGDTHHTIGQLAASDGAAPIPGLLTTSEVQVELKPTGLHVYKPADATNFTVKKTMQYARASN